MYSAWDHIKGMAAPVGFPRYMWDSGRSKVSHTCSGSNPVEVAKASMACKKGSRAAAGGQFVVSPFAGQERPGAARAPAIETRSIVALAVAVVVIAVPARAEGRVSFQHGIDDFQRVHDDGIVRSTDSVAHQFQESGVHDLFGGKGVLRFRRTVRQDQGPCIGILVRAAIGNTHRVDADVMPVYAWDEGALGRDRPGLHMALEEVGVVL